MIHRNSLFDIPDVSIKKRDYTPIVIGRKQNSTIRSPQSIRSSSYSDLNWRPTYSVCDEHTNRQYNANKCMDAAEEIINHRDEDNVCGKTSVLPASANNFDINDPSTNPNVHDANWASPEQQISWEDFEVGVYKIDKYRSYAMRVIDFFLEMHRDVQSLMHLPEHDRLDLASRVWAVISYKERKTYLDGEHGTKFLTKRMHPLFRQVSDEREGGLILERKREYNRSRKRKKRAAAKEAAAVKKSKKKQYNQKYRAKLKARKIEERRVGLVQEEAQQSSFIGSQQQNSTRLHLENTMSQSERSINKENQVTEDGEIGKA